MIAQAIIVHDKRLLMVKQYVSRGDIVWTFPGGGIEENETREQACIREVKEETGYDVSIVKLLNSKDEKYCYIARITGGTLYLDKGLEANSDIIELAWVDVEDTEKFDSVTAPMLKLYLSNNEPRLLENNAIEYIIDRV